MCLSLITLWARSYWKLDVASGNKGSRFIYLSILRGEFHFSRIVTPAGFPIEPWRLRLHRQITDGDLEAHENSQRGTQRLLGFGWKVFGNGWQINVPLWQPILLSVAFATAVCLPWHFSLRTLLIATALVGVLLGVIAYSVR